MVVIVGSLCVIALSNISILTGGCFKRDFGNCSFKKVIKQIHKDISPNLFQAKNCVYRCPNLTLCGKGHGAWAVGGHMNPD